MNSHLFHKMILLDLLEGMRLARIEFVVFSPPLRLVGIYKATIHLLLAVEDLAAMMLNIDHILLQELIIGIGPIVQIARLPDQHRGHLVNQVLLPGIQRSEV